MSLQRPHTRALVAGGTGRVGRVIVERLRADGWNVVAAGRADGDLRTRDGAAQLVDRALDELGGLDLVVHAAGDGFVPKPVDEVTEADWDAALGVTAKGTFFLAQAAAPALRAAHGVLVILEDVASFQAWPAFAPHSAAKAAQAMLTRVFARALAPDVRVCGIAPGPVAVAPEQETRRAAETLLGRVGSPDHVAEAVVYLAGADYVTGTTLVIDGGQLLKTVPRGDP
jgi:pteridine reductase